MHAAILHTLTGEPTGELTPALDDGLPAAAVDQTAYLDGQTIHDGTLAGRVAEETDVPVLGEDFIATAREERQREVVAEFYADLDAGWAGVDSGDGIPLLESYLRTAGVRVAETECRLDAWSERLQTAPDAEVWGMAYAQSIDDGHHRDAAGARYHDDADVDTLPVNGNAVIGFEYRWNGAVARGVLTASGYVAIYRDWPVEQFARWVSEEVAEYLQPATDDQQVIGVAECERCGRESESVDGTGLCVVCRDATEDAQAGDA